MITKKQINSLDWDKMDNLIPAIVQHADTGIVLMLGYMNLEALEQTITTKRVTFFSRSKERLWVKGEISGNYLNLVNIESDCDQDGLLILAHPEGVTCHTGEQSCFPGSTPTGFIYHLERILSERKKIAPDQSYTAKLYCLGTKRIAQKVGEEGVETALAAVSGDKVELINETSDLIYHLIVLLQDQNINLEDIELCLKKRMDSAVD